MCKGVKQFIQKKNLSFPVKKDNLNIEIFNDYLKNHNDITFCFHKRNTTLL